MPEKTEVHITGPDGHSEVIDTSNLRPITNAGCKHEYVPDPTDETESYIAMICKHCVQGYLARKHT